MFNDNQIIGWNQDDVVDFLKIIEDHIINYTIVKNILLMIILFNKHLVY